MRYFAHITTTALDSSTVSIKLHTNSFDQLARVLDEYNLSINQLELVRYKTMYYYAHNISLIKVARRVSVNDTNLNLSQNYFK